MKPVNASFIIRISIFAAILLFSGCSSDEGNDMVYEITSLTVIPEYLFADNNALTHADVRVIIVNENGDAAQGVPVNFETDLGSIIAQVNTDENGIAVSELNDDGHVGIANISAYLNANESQAMFTFIDILPICQIASLTINPDSLYADNNELTYAVVRVTIVDSLGFPVQSIPVSFTADLGIIQDRVYTDDNGVALNTFFDDGIIGVAHIAAFIDGLENQVICDSINITSFKYLFFDSISATPDTIYLDNGITFSEIEVVLKNQDGLPAVDEYVYFYTDIGDIITPAVTDSNGVAVTTFWDAGVIGTAQIDAFADIADTTINVVILNQPAVSNITLDIGENSLTVNSVRPIEASAGNDIGYVSDGRIIIFETLLGYFQPSEEDNTFLGTSVSATTLNGTASVFLNAGTQAGMNTITAEIDADGNGTMLQDSAQMLIISGEPAQMTLIPRNASDEPQDYILVDSPQNLYIWAYIQDSFGNPISNDYEINFETDLGTIESPVCVTDGGIAVSPFSPGPIPGVAEITASAGNASASALVNVLLCEVNSIQFADLQQINIYVQNGFPDFADIAVNLLDINGSIFEDPTEVWFKFLVRPDGSNINSEVYNLADSTSTISAGGTASVTVNSGTVSGNIVIKAWCRTLADEIISDTKSNIFVLPGAPALCEISMSGIDSAEDIGNGLWKAQISAFISDEWNNPVADGIMAYFYLDPLPEYASIFEPAAFVGNENANGDTLEGTAFSYIIFDGTYTNETVTLKIDFGSEIPFEEDMVLPLQFGEINMICVPTHLEWTVAGDQEDKRSQCRISVNDGQQNPVSNQRILFTTSLGSPTDQDIHPVLEDITDPLILAAFDWDDINEDGDEDDGFTGWYEGELGRLYKYVVFHKYECPPPLPSPPGTTTASINAYIFGTNVSTTQTVTLYRYTD